MSCAEYDRFLADPVNFRSTFEVENERVECEKEASVRGRRVSAVVVSWRRQIFAFARSLADNDEARIQAEARAERGGRKGRGGTGRTERKAAE